MAKAVIFDFDNTLLLLNVRWDLVKADIVRLAKSGGADIDENMHIIPLTNLLSGTAERKSAIDRIYLAYEEKCVRRKDYRLFPDMLSLARELKAEGCRTAIASGNHTITLRAVLAEIGMLDAFDVICGRDMVARNKPAPDQVHLVLEKLGIGPGDALFVGDSANDEAAARDSGVAFFRVKDPKADAARLRAMLL